MSPDLALDVALRAREREIVRELRRLAHNPQLKRLHLLEWDDAPLQPEPGETVFYLPQHRVYAAVKSYAVRDKTL